MNKKGLLKIYGSTLINLSSLYQLVHGASGGIPVPERYKPAFEIQLDRKKGIKIVNNVRRKP